MKIIIYIILNFLVGFISDIILNLLSVRKENAILFSLRSYFKNKTFIQSAIYAGLTIVFALVILMFLSKMILGFYIPNKNKDFIQYLLLAFPLGYIIDILISRLHVFGHDLDEYYEVAGEGFWGSASFLFSLTISYIVFKLFFNMFIARL